MRIIQSANPRPLNLLAISSNGLVAAASATFGAPGDVEVWDATSGKLVQTVREPQGPATGLAFAPHGPSLLKCAGGFGVSIFDTRDWLPWTGPEFDVRIRSAEFALTATGARLLVSDHRDSFPGRLSYWGLGDERHSTPSLVWQEEATGHTRYGTPAVRLDGTLAATTLHDWSTDRTRITLQVRDGNTGKPLVTIPTEAASPVRQLAFTADGAKLLARTDGRAVQVYDAATGAPAGELVHAGRPFVTGIAVHPRGATSRSVAACCRTTGTVCLWDVEKREQLRTFDWKAGKLVSVAFSRDGALAAAGTEDGKVVVWDVDL